MSKTLSPAAQLEFITKAVANLTEQIKANPESMFDSKETLMTKSFKILPSSLDKLLDIVNYYREKGDFEYTQTQALAEALDILYSSLNPRPRPQAVRDLEDDRSKKIISAKKRRKLEQTQQVIAA
jgi:ribosomal protein S15P/S13E